MLTGAIFGLFMLLVACNPTSESEMEIQPLPPLTRPSPEARLGLPELAGRWRFAGWQLGTPDTAMALAGGLPAPGELLIRAQQLDSVAGVLATGAGPTPVVGEVRRGGGVALVAFGPGPERSFLAGHLIRDTLWVEMSSLAVAEAWPPGTRIAFARDSVGSPFVRLPGGRTIVQATPDTAVIASDSAAAPVSPAGAAAGLAPAPRTPIQPPATTPAEPEPSPRQQPVRTAPSPSPPASPEPVAPIPEPQPDSVAPPPGPELDLSPAPQPAVVSQL